MRKGLLICGFLFVLCTLLVFAASTSLTPIAGRSNSTPTSVYVYIYGNYSLTKTQDGSCPNGGSSTTCWATGVRDVATSVDVYFWQDYDFNVSSLGISGTDISNVTVCLDACWTGGVNGCSSSDRPEFDSTNGTAQIQIFNGATWDNVGSAINLGNEAQGTAYSLATYCRSKTSGFVAGHITSGLITSRILISGESADNFADVEMFTDYVSLNISYTVPTTTTTTTTTTYTTTTTTSTTTTTTKKSSGGGGGSSCIPEWECDDWGECDIYGYKYRSCYDVNDCNIIDGVPDTFASCSGSELCNNGRRDNQEEGIDCGGPCEPCAAGIIEPEEVTEPTQVQQPAPVLPEELCPAFGWPFWILYAFILLLSYFTTYKFKNIALKFRKKYLLELMIGANVLLIILVLLDIGCSFRWYMILLLLIIFMTILYLIKIMHTIKTVVKKK